MCTLITLPRGHISQHALLGHKIHTLLSSKSRTNAMLANSKNLFDLVFIVPHSKAQISISVSLTWQCETIHTNISTRSKNRHFLSRYWQMIDNHDSMV